MLYNSVIGSYFPRGRLNLPSGLNLERLIFKKQLIFFSELLIYKLNYIYISIIYLSIYSYIHPAPILFLKFFINTTINLFLSWQRVDKIPSSVGNFTDRRPETLNWMECFEGLFNDLANERINESLQLHEIMNTITRQYKFCTVVSAWSLILCCIFVFLH